MDRLEAVLEQLGSPRQWVPDEQAPAEARRIVREPLRRHVHRALLAAGLGLVISALLLLFGIRVLGLTRSAFSFVGRGLVWTLRRDAPLWLGFVGALVATAAAIAPRAQIGAARHHIVRSFAATVVGLSVLAAVGLVALVVVDRTLLNVHHPGALSVMNVRWGVARALLVTAWLVPWIAYSCAFLVAMATRPERAGTQRAYFLGLLLWSPVLAIAIFIVSIWSLTLDLNVVAPAIAGLAIFAAAGLPRIMLPARSAVAPTPDLARGKDTATLVGRAMLTLGISLAPIVLFYCRGIAAPGVRSSHMRPIVENGVVYVAAGLVLGVALALWRRPRQPLQHKYLATGAGLALTILVIAVHRDVALVDMIGASRVFVVGHATPTYPTAVPSLARALVCGVMLLATMALVAYLAGQLLMSLLAHAPRARRAKRLPA